MGLLIHGQMVLVLSEIWVLRERERELGQKDGGRLEISVGALGEGRVKWGSGSGLHFGTGVLCRGIGFRSEENGKEVSHGSHGFGVGKG